MTSKEKSSGALILIFSVAFILYANTLGHEYALDDTMMITENSFTLKGIDGFGNILTNDAFVGLFGEDRNLLEGGRYRPLSHLTFALEYELFGKNPFIGHLVNAVWYALLCCFIFLTLKLIFPYGNDKSKWYLSLPFVISLLYALHPIHTEVVANIKGRDELMAMFFSIATLYFYLQFVNNRKFVTGLLVSISFLLALLSKENSLTFLVVIPLTVYYFTSHSLKVNLKNLYVILIPVLVFFILRYNALGFFLGTGKESGELLNNPFLHASSSEKYATIFYTMGVYIKLLFFPHPLTHDYYPKHIPIVGWENPVVIISFLVYVALGIIALKTLKNKHPVGYGIWFYLLTFSIFTNLFVSIGTFMNERFMFMPSLGFAIVIGYFLQKAITGNLLTNKAMPAMALLLSAFIALGYSYKTYTRNKAWKNDYVLFTTDVQTSVNSAKVNVSAGGALIDKAVLPGLSDYQKHQKLTQAVHYLQHGLNIHPKYTAGWLLLGNGWFHLDNYKKSMEAFFNCLEINPRYQVALKNLSMLGRRALREKELDVAMKSFEKLISVEPQKACHYYQMALVYEEKEIFDKAINFLESAVEKDNTHYRALRKLGEIEGKIFGNINKSIKYLVQAHNINPGDITTLENLGVAYGLSGDFEKSLDYFYKALEQNPDNAQLLGNISLTYRRMGMNAKAMEYMERRKEAAN